MSYFVFTKNSENEEGSLCKIAENESDLNYLNIVKDAYTILEDTLENFNDVKFGNKAVIKYSNNSVIYDVANIYFYNSWFLTTYINQQKNEIQNFLNNNPNHPLFNRWQNYYNQLNSFNVDSVQYPFQISLEKHFDNLQLTSYCPLQIP